MATLLWAYGVVSDAGEIAALVLSPLQWQLVGGGLFVVSILSILFQWHSVRLATPTTEPARAPAPNVSFNISSHNQSGGITAQTVNVGHRPRSIFHSAARDLRQYLLTSIPKAGPWDIVALMGDAEAFGFASEIHQFMRDNGFIMKEQDAVQGVFQRPLRDVTIQHENKTVIIGTNTGLKRK